jgi:hypothetical protein
MTLRQRIEQRITDLRVERGIAAAAMTDTTGRKWEANTYRDSTGALKRDVAPEFPTDEQNRRVWVGEMTWAGVEGPDAEAVATHIATQDPATTIARTDRELAVCAADLALLDWMERPVQVNTPSRWDGYALANLEARYPE